MAASMWIGLEGTDGVGKSSLAETVRKELEARYGAATLIHKGPPERSVLKEYATDVEGREDEHLVFDRWHLGTLVYAPLYRATGPFGELGVSGFRWVEKFLQARGAQFYVVDLPYPVVAARLEARGEDYLQSHHVEGVLERFREVNELSILTRSLFTPIDEIAAIPVMAKLIVDDALARTGDVAWLRSFRSYVGGVAPEVLLVGEKRGGRPPFASDACFMPLRNKSGEYLWDALPEDFWRGVGAANAYEDDVPALWDLLNRPRVVALGGAAHRELKKHGVPHSVVPHPQKVKRFFNRHQQAYGELVAKVSETEEDALSWRP